MNTTKKLICILTAGAMLGAAAPVFADSWRDRGYGHHRHGYRHYDRHHLVVVERPYVVHRSYVVERPVYYYREPAPTANIGLGAMIGAVIGGYIDSRQ